MHYLLWLFALGFLGGAFYADAVAGDLAVLGMLLAAIGWGLAGFMSMQAKRISEGWERALEK
jgi:small-conductance mechanosensitive channel